MSQQPTLPISLAAKACREYGLAWGHAVLHWSDVHIDDVEHEGLLGGIMNVSSCMQAMQPGLWSSSGLCVRQLTGCGTLRTLAG